MQILIPFVTVTGTGMACRTVIDWFFSLLISAPRHKAAVTGLTLVDTYSNSGHDEPGAAASMH